eukprot:CAMPEP_0194218772 /NCGR_PEP_ID=MMETSP0156-20130528/24518_1 /TAXON_ID=33649 /ORGANISM="Thalassionema nitzschioides, Strain L26-B" /LENGTH=190 /DNA_ID=CAMNT_0038948239 /DNA_START=201 /DNA_END=773 /DNA_ORIENTATION=+
MTSSDMFSLCKLYSSDANRNISGADETVDDLSVDWNWEKLSATIFLEDKRPVILFDGICNLCSGGVNFVMDRDEKAKLRFCSLHTKAAESLLLRSGRSPESKDIALVTETEAYFSSDAVSRICMELDTKPLQFFGQLGQYTPNFVREGVYNLVSTNRYNFGQSDSCRIDFDGTYTSRFVSDPMNEMDYQT